MLVKNRKNNSRQYFVKYGEKLEENIEVSVCDASKRYFFLNSILQYIIACDTIISSKENRKKEMMKCT